ncbi:MAG: zinc metallopeptidase [Firmicutes bacterium]|nr:zinc metallopeptidase [Bacillota bacterium]
MPYYYDATWLLLLPALALSLYAQFKVTSTYKKYAEVQAASGIAANDMARQLLDYNGLEDVPVEMVAGSLTDHYDPRSRVLRLSQTTYSSRSVAALGVAAHEAGHAMQHGENYGPLKLRSLMAPVAQVGSSASWILILIGILLNAMNLVGLGILFFTAAVAFQLVTLPVEFNASSRALAALEGGGFLTREETDQTAQVLRAAALTYVAAALTGLLQLLRLIVIFGGRRE